MRRELIAGMMVMALLLGLAGCGEQPVAPAEQPAAETRAETAAPPAEEAPAEEAPAEEAPAEDETGDTPAAAVQFDQVLTTKGGQIAYSQASQLLEVEAGGSVVDYQVAPVERKLTDEQQRRVVESVSAALRYPADRVIKVSGTFVKERTDEGNELAAATFHTDDSVADVAAHYDGRLRLADANTYRVAVPFGDSQVLTYHLGMGARRYRLLVAPEGKGSRVEVTQLYIAGSGNENWFGGQAVGAAPAAPEAPADALTAEEEAGATDAE